MQRHRRWENVARVLRELLRDASPRVHRSTFCDSRATPQAETQLATQVWRRRMRTDAYQPGFLHVTRYAAHTVSY